jgi:hypothetical protein
MTGTVVCRDMGAGLSLLDEGGKPGAYFEYLAPGGTISRRVARVPSSGPVWFRQRIPTGPEDVTRATRAPSLGNQGRRRLEGNLSGSSC